MQLNLLDVKMESFESTAFLALQCLSNPTSTDADSSVTWARRLGHVPRSAVRRTFLLVCLGHHSLLLLASARSLRQPMLSSLRTIQGTPCPQQCGRCLRGPQNSALLHHLHHTAPRERMCDGTFVWPFPAFSTSAVYFLIFS